MKKSMNEIVHDGQRYMLAGRGKAPGSQVFLNAKNGEYIDIYLAKVTGSNRQSATAEVVGNKALSNIRVAHNVVRNSTSGLREGDAILLDLRFGHHQPMAISAWMVDMAGSNEPTRHNGDDRIRGSIKLMKTVDYGFICFDNKPDAFFHRRYLQHASQRPLSSGMRVECRLVHNERGTMAVDVNLI